MIHCPSSSTTDPGQLVLEGPLRPHMSHSQDSERCSDNTPRDAGLSSDPQLHAIQVPSWLVKGGPSTGCSSPKGVLLLEIVQLTAVRGSQSLCHSPGQLWSKYATLT